MRQPPLPEGHTNTRIQRANYVAERYTPLTCKQVLCDIRRADHLRARGMWLALPERPAICSRTDGNLATSSHHACTHAHMRQQA